MKYLYYILGIIIFIAGMILTDGKTDFKKGLGCGLCGVGGMFIYMGLINYL